MSYCVHCGVELAESEKRCPLCNTEVLDPAAEPKGEVHYPYPERIQLPSVQYRRGVAVFLSLALLIPLICVLIVDFSSDGALDWSLIAGSAIFLLFFTFLFPNLFKKIHLWLFLLLDIPVVWMFLSVTCLVLRGDWWLMPALPLTLLAGAFVIGIYLMFSAKKPTLGLKCIVLLLAVMVLSVCAQMVIELYLHGRLFFSWSIYIAVASAVMSIVILVIDSMYHFSERLRKKMFL